MITCSFGWSNDYDRKEGENDKTSQNIRLFNDHQKSPASFGWTCQQSSHKEKSDQLLVLQSFNLSNFNSISFWHCIYLFVLFFDYLNRTLVARTPRIAISKKYHFRKCIMIFTRTFLKIVINKSIVIVTKIFLNNFASLLPPIRYIFSLYWILIITESSVLRNAT